MKALAGVLLVCLPGLLMAAERDNDARGMLSVYGSVQPSCNVYLDTEHPLARPIEALRYHLATPQIVAQVVLTCNRGDERVRVTYESVNGGLLDVNGELMEYEKSLSGTFGTALASAGPWTIAQRAGQRHQFLRVRPLNKGDTQGPYSDVILVSIAAN